MKSTRKLGFTLVEIMIVVAIIGILAAIAIPSFVQSRTQTRTNACINNLRLLDAAKEQAALANNWDVGDACGDADVIPYMKGNAMPVCPGQGAGSYTVGAIGADPVCSAGAPHILP